MLENTDLLENLEHMHEHIDHPICLILALIRATDMAAGCEKTCGIHELTLMLRMLAALIYAGQHYSFNYLKLAPRG